MTNKYNGQIDFWDLFKYGLLLKIKNWKYCNKIIFKYVNNIVGPRLEITFIKRDTRRSHEQYVRATQENTNTNHNAFTLLSKPTLRVRRGFTSISLFSCVCVKGEPINHSHKIIYYYYDKIIHLQLVHISILLTRARLRYCSLSFYFKILLYEYFLIGWKCIF